MKQGTLTQAVKSLVVNMTLIGAGITIACTVLTWSLASGQQADQAPRNNAGLVQRVTDLEKLAEKLSDQLKALRTEPRVVAVGVVNMAADGGVNTASVRQPMKQGMSVFLTVKSSNNSSDDQMPLITWRKHGDNGGFDIVMRNAIGNLGINRQNDAVNVQWVVIQNGVARAEANN